MRVYMCGTVRVCAYMHASKKMSTRVCGRYLDLALQYDVLSLAICFVALRRLADTETKRQICPHIRVHCMHTIILSRVSASDSMRDICKADLTADYLPCFSWQISTDLKQPRRPRRRQ